MSEIKPIHVPTLLELLLLGAKNQPVEISTTELATRIDKSQQAASKHLLELEKEGYIERIRSGKRNSVKLTQKGADAMTSLYIVLRGILEEAPVTLEVKGEVFSGLREGAYYVSLRGYRRQFVKKLGFDPYPGTLNLRLTSALDKRLRKELEHHLGIAIEEFEDDQRTYSPAKCFPAIINGTINGAVILIKRTHYDDSVLEILAPVNIREKIGVKDGERVNVKVFLAPGKGGIKSLLSHQSS